MCEAPSCDRLILPQKLFCFTDNYPNTQGYSKTVKWQSILALSAESDVITPVLLSKNAYEYAMPVFEQLKILSEDIVSIRDKIYEQCDIRIVNELDGTDIHSKLTSRFVGTFSRLFNSEYKSIISSMQAYSKSGEKLKYQQAVNLSEKLMKLQSLNRSFIEIESTVQGSLGSCYKGPDTDWNHVMSTLQVLQDFFEPGTSKYGVLSTMTTEQFTDKQKMFHTDAELLSKEIQSVDKIKQRIQEFFDTQVLDLESNGYEYCIDKIKGCLEEYGKLGNWINFMGLLDQLSEFELLPFIDLTIKNQISADDIPGTYRRAFYKQWIEYIIFTVPEINAFSRIRQDQAVQSFVAKDSIQYDISKIQIKSELSQKRPNLNLVAGGSAVSILRREGKKKRKQMPIRKLLSETCELVQIIKPCFLMSPLSVSTFLDPGKIIFDTIVFDEASQIFPWDAIGAIYRGKQLIVVGDSKQMPPSNFFNSSTDISDDEEEIGDITDFESILDICSSVFDTERLAWHYRSHYEQLIAFSNANFYNNHLITFPSSTTNHKGIGVDHYYVNGVFDRKSKTNKPCVLG